MRLVKELLWTEHSNCPIQSGGLKKPEQLFYRDAIFSCKKCENTFLSMHMKVDIFYTLVENSVNSLLCFSPCSQNL